MRNLVVVSTLTVTLIGSSLLSACSGDDKKDKDNAKEGAGGAVQLLTAEAPSTHYVNLTFSKPVGSAGSETSSYVIRDASGALLPVSAASVDGGGTLVTLTTAAQTATQYQLLLAMNLGVGSAGFTGSVDDEPYLDSALSLSDTTLQLTFSERLDKQFAENPASYRLLDPDTDQDVDIVITAARLNDDLRTVVLTTSPQENRLYTVQVTNVKARFSCSDGDVSDLTAAKAGMMCAAGVRPRTNAGSLARLELSARTTVDKTQNTNATANGTVGTVQIAAQGAGVASATCTGNPCATSTGASANEELTLKFDVATRADTVVLNMAGLGQAHIVMFLSSSTAPGFDYTVQTTEIEAVAVGNSSELHFDELKSLPANLMIDQIRVRATAASSCLASVCVSDGRIIDPTRSLANFYGIPTVDNAGPRVVEAKSTSATTVLVTFNEPLDNKAADPTHYTISPNLVVTGAIQTEYQTQVLLTTTRQVADTQYTVTVTGVRDRARNGIDTTANTAMFRGISRELYLDTAIALSSTQVQLTFSEPMDPTTTQNIKNYDIADPDMDTDIDITITGAMASADGKTVVLTTSPQSNTVYQITATNIRAIRDNFFIDPMRNSVQFHGIPPVDTTPPRVVSVVSASDTTILVTFNEPVRDESADPANFSISPSLNVLKAELTDQQNQILLTTAPQQADVSYTVTVTNVRDKAGNAIAAGSGSSATFVFNGTPETADGSAAPRVVGAASTSNTTVVVTFSKAMSDDAIVASSYVIVQQDVNPEVGTVSVVSARFLGTDGTAVELTTRAQNEVNYVVTVTNVRDRSGNQLAPLELQAGVSVNPSSATFAGSAWSCGPRLCSNGKPGLGEGQCGSDDDCTTDGSCDPKDSPACVGACQVACSTPDADGDGMADNDEQRGWVIHVTLVDGTSFDRQVTSNPDVQDTDGDGLSDDTERSIGSDPRDQDSDDDRINDYDEYNVTYTDATLQDTDGDTLDDYLEVEFYKTNALVADSDGDGFDDGDELFSLHRDPRIADLPGHSISVGSVRLQLDQRFTYLDASGKTHSETQSTSSALQNDSSSSTSNLNQTVGHWLLGVQAGFDSCQADNACLFLDELTWVDRLYAGVNIEGGQEFTTANTTDSERATSQAYEQGIEKGLELSSSSEVDREVVGASILVDVSFTNTSDVAVTLENVEVHAATTAPNDPTNLVPLATLLPESTLTSGQAQVLHLAPGQTLGPIVFANRDVYPSVVEDLMRAPRGIVFNVANYDIETSDGRNFAQGLQAVNDHTVAIRIDKGDGHVDEFHAITAGVRDRPADDLRCAETGDHPGALCSIDTDCGTSKPCEGGKIIGGFSEFAGTGGETPLPLDFVLRDILGMRKSRPAMILAGGTIAGTTARTTTSVVGTTIVTSAVNPNSDDVQVALVGTTVTRGQVVVAPGRNGILETTPAGTDYNSEGLRVLAGPNGAVESAVDSTKLGHAVQILAAGAFPLAPADVVIGAGPSGKLDAPSGDDVVIGPDGIRSGVNGAVDSVARGDDVQVIPLGTTGVPEDAVAISAGADGVLQTRPAGDDTQDVITGYEVSHTCSGDTPTRILAGPNGIAETTAETGACAVAYAPHYPGEKCANDLQCGTDASSGHNGTCRSDVQAKPVDPAILLTPDTVVVAPGGGAGVAFLASVPAGDDVYVGPSIPCTVDADCKVVGVAATGTCDGPEQVVRVAERRRGQYRRKWAMLMSDGTQLETDFSQVRVRPGDQMSLAFVQDIDRDGLTSTEEFLHGSSDFTPDTDHDGLGDFSEIRIGWEVGVVGQPLRRSLPDPRRADSDGDGLLDREEQDLRVTRCVCDAVGPKSLRGSGNLVRGVNGTDSARPCTSDAQCNGGSGTCRDAVNCAEGGVCPVCPADVTLYRTDPRERDTDGDLVSDADETFGYLTGAGIVDPSGTAATKRLVLAGPNKVADTQACPGNHCIEDTGTIHTHCMTDADCVASHVCVHSVPCDDVQVVPQGTTVENVRTVVAIVAAGVALTPGIDDVLVSTGDGKAQSLLAGDDPLVVGPGQSVKNVSNPTQCEDGGNFLFCSAIKPGADGVISSTLGGDDALVRGGSGQRLETSDPLSPDTDMDLVADGYERRLGSSPNKPGDASFGGDTDQDGLTDSTERAGWTVTVNDVPSANPVSSNVSLPDTDSDGLPDYAERNLPCYKSIATDFTSPRCPTDPTKADTDGDGIQDLDELSTAQLNALGAFAAQFPGYVLDAGASAAFGTDPTKKDSDGDGLDDSFELFTGWQVVRSDGSVSSVLSDPKNPDTDSDGLADGLEYTAKTDPKDPDTDGDGRTDGQEAKIGSSPLRPDLSVTVTYTAIDLRPPDGENPLEWKWGFFVQLPGGAFPGALVSDQSHCPKYDNCICSTTEEERRLPLNQSIAVELAPGEALVLSGQIRETHEDHAIACPNGDQSANISKNDGDRYMAYVDQPITYEQLQGGQFLSRAITMASTDDKTNTGATVYAEIAVNCAGSGRSICRTGALCVDDDDCESQHCTLDGTKKRCTDYCGDGTKRTDEACDDGNKLGCGTCNADCSATQTFPLCAGGAGCTRPEDCASNQCELPAGAATGSPKQCKAKCGNGFVEGSEICDDGNAVACGSCNSTCTAKPSSVTGCAVGVGCVQPSDCTNGNCVNGVCAALCGNGLVESGETCDDGNVDACGTCSATCTATAASGCPTGVTCTANAVCASNSCVAGACAP